MAVRTKLRFTEGAMLRVTAGEHAGIVGTVEKIQTNLTRPYWVRLPSGSLEALADDALEPVLGE